MKIKQLEWVYDKKNDMYDAKFRHKYFTYTLAESSDMPSWRARFELAGSVSAKWWKGRSIEDLKQACQDHYESIIREGLE